MKPKLIVIAGPALSGKTTLGRSLEMATGIHYCDSDDLRVAAFGLPTHAEYAKQWEDPERGAKFIHGEMVLNYRLLHEAVNLALEANRSLIISATYARKSSQNFLREIVRKYDAQLRAVVCKIEAATTEELERRMQRDRDKPFVTGVNNWTDYENSLSHYEWPQETGIFESTLVIDTNQPIANYLHRTVKFVLAD